MAQTRTLGRRSIKPAVLIGAGVAGLLILGSPPSPTLTTAMDLPMDMRSGIAMRSTPFRPDRSGLYDVDLEVERSLGDARTLCLVGVAGCPQAPALALSWSVAREDGGVAALGRAKPEQQVKIGATIVRALGHAALRAGALYRLEATPLSEAGVLNPANPRILIRARSVPTADRVLQWRALAAAAGLLVTCGVLWAAAVFVVPATSKARSA